MEKDKVIEKIKKCFALSKSANEHEAAAAMRQAMALMRKHDITHSALLASEVSEVGTKASARRYPADWETSLAAVVAKAFACRCLFSANGQAPNSSWNFIGCGSNPDIASYAFTVLRRQAKKQRMAFVSDHCKRSKPAIKIRRADLFCDAWVTAVRRQVEEFAGSGVNQSAIDAFFEQRYPKLSALKSNNRSDGLRLRDKDLAAINAGYQAGQEAQLRSGIGGDDKMSLKKLSHLA